MSKAQYTATIDECRRGVQLLENAAEEYTREWQAYKQKYNAWNARKTAHNEFLQRERNYIDSARRAPRGSIWNYEKSAYKNCGEVGVSKNFAGSLYNCNTYGGSSAVRKHEVYGCQSCGYRATCMCTSGLDGECNSGRCRDYTSISPADFRNTRIYTTWRARQIISGAQVSSPGAAPPRPSPPKITADIVCTACSSEVNFANITAGGDINAQVDQTQNCISNLIKKKEDAESAAAAEARRLAAEAAARADAARQAKQERIAEAAEQRARELREARIAAQDAERERTVFESNAAEQARQRQIQLFIFLIVFMFVLVIGTVMAIYTT